MFHNKKDDDLSEDLSIEEPLTPEEEALSEMLPSSQRGKPSICGACGSEIFKYDILICAECLEFETSEFLKFAENFEEIDD